MVGLESFTFHDINEVHHVVCIGQRVGANGDVFAVVCRPDLPGPMYVTGQVFILKDGRKTVRNLGLRTVHGDRARAIIDFAGRIA